MRRSEEQVDNLKRERQRGDVEAKEHKEAIDKLAANIATVEAEAKQMERKAAQQVHPRREGGRRGMRS